MTPLIKLGPRWVQPEHIVRLSESPGGNCVVWMIDEKSFAITMTPGTAVELINNALTYRD